MDYFSGKRVLITGATGLIGSHIVDVLMSRKDIEVIALSHNLHKLEEGFQNYLKEPGFQIIFRSLFPRRSDRSILFCMQQALYPAI